MDVARRSSAGTPAVTARLQPDGVSTMSAGGSAAPPASPSVMSSAAADTRDLLTHLAEVDRGDGLDDDERADLDAARDRLRRRGEDQQIVVRLAACGFTGPHFEALQAELVAYAFPVMLSWIRRGVIFQLCANRGRPVTAPDHVRRRLSEQHDDRLELANETIAEALAVFVRLALREGRWSAERGASLKTYLVGACINAFSNVFRRWLAEQDHQAVPAGQNAASEVPGNPLFPAIDVDPADAVISEHLLRDELARLDPGLREVAIRIAFNGETQGEAGEALGLGQRAVEGRFYRLRKKRLRRDQGQEGGQP